MNTEMDKYWELILKHKRLIYSVICKYTKRDVDDIAHDAMILIYLCLCNKGDVDHDTFVSIVHGRVRDIRKRNARRNKDIPLDDYLIDFAYYGVINKKRESGGDTVVEKDFTSEGGDTYAA